MDYIWDKFNIKTRPAKTIVFVDSEFQPEISEMPDDVDIKQAGGRIEINIKQPADLPIHIIMVGEIDGQNDIFIRNSVEKQQVFMTAKLQNKNPAFLTFFIENTGFLSVIDASVTIQNFNNLKYSVFADHLGENTGVFVKNRILAHAGSTTDLSAVAKIVANAAGAKSDISFSAMCAPDIKSIKFAPNQQIAAVPMRAEHSADIYRGTAPQIQFLAAAGMTPDDIAQTLQTAFLDA